MNTPERGGLHTVKVVILAEKITFDKIPSNAVYSAKLLITEDLLEKFGTIAGDYNPLHTNEQYARGKGFKNRVAYGNILGLLISQLVGMHLWSENVMLISEKIDFRRPVYNGDCIIVTGRISQKSAVVNIIELSLVFTNNSEEIVASGKCQVRSFDTDGC